MCTLILGVHVVEPRTVLLAANRDEDPGRPSDPPVVLSERPRIVGGRDRVAGGTWLAVREGPAAVALLNRRPRSGLAPPERSRGLLTLDVARAPVEWGQATARKRLEEARYAPFTLLYATPAGAWILAHDGAKPRLVDLTPGWHVLTHQELDDPKEPRAARLVRTLRDSRPGSTSEAEALVTGLLRGHGEQGTPPVCLHQGPMITVSSSIVWLSEGGARYVHAEGRPCTHAYADQSRLLEPALEGGRS